MPVYPDIEPLTTAARVGAFLAQDVEDMAQVDSDSLDQACVDASAIVLDHLMRSDLYDLTPEVQAGVVFVATKVAARIYRNPNELTVDSMGDASHTYVDPRILTSDEKMLLRRARSARVVRGPIQTLGPA